MSNELHKAGDWMKVFRRIRFTSTRDGVRGATIKAVGSMLATYANYKDGTRVHPGTARVAVDCEIDYRTAKRCIAILRDLGLILLVKKSEKRGLADEYRLDIPEDILDRVEIDVWDPERYHMEISTVREKNRGKYVPKNRDDTGLRGTAGTAEVGESESIPEKSAGHAEDRRIESAGHGGTNLRDTPCPPTYQSNSHLSELPTDGGNQSAQLTDSCARSHEDPNFDPPANLANRPRCPHGRSPRRNDNGQPRCVDCRADEAANTCSHGVDRRYRCPACRRGLTGGTP